MVKRLAFTSFPASKKFRKPSLVAMAGNDPQKQLLSLIRDFASEKSHGARQIANLKKRIEELRSELSEANAELEDAKVGKESTEQELKGYEVELAMTEASIQSIEARIAAVQDEISAHGSDLEALKSEGAAKRDDFIKKMQEFNAYIRKFQESVAFVSDEDYSGATSRTGVCKITNTNKTEVVIRDLENELAQTISQMNLVEREYQTEQNVYKLVQQELIDLDRKASLMEKIEKGNAEFRELTRLTSECERTCASLSDELQGKFLCPTCQRDNSEALDGLIQTCSRT